MKRWGQVVVNGRPCQDPVYCTAYYGGVFMCMRLQGYKLYCAIYSTTVMQYLILTSYPRSVDWSAMPLLMQRILQTGTPTQGCHPRPRREVSGMP